MMNIPELDKVASVIADTAAEIMMPRFRNLDSAEIREKTPGDLVTVVDTEMEARLTSILGDLAPGSLVVGEEAVSTNADLLSALSEPEPVWIIDPLDGTSSFASGKATFACIVALSVGGQTVAGWIHDPVDGRMVVAEKGQGAFSGGQRLSTRRDMSADALKGHSGAFTLPRREGPRRAALLKLSGELRRAGRVRCAGQEYLSIAGGNPHVAVFNRLHPWDHAAGVLIVNESGGHSRTTPTPSRQYGLDLEKGPMVVAPSTEIADLVTAVTGPFGSD